MRERRGEGGRERKWKSGVRGRVSVCENQRVKGVGESDSAFQS